MAQRTRTPDETQSGQQTPHQEQSPRPVPAPRRIEQFVYNVTVDNRTYRLTIDERLPVDSSGNLDVAAARRRLNDALLHNEPVALGGRMRSNVEMVGNGQEVARFNSGPVNQRMDIFRDRYLSKTYVDGKYVETNNVVIAQLESKPRGG